MSTTNTPTTVSTLTPNDVITIENNSEKTATLRIDRIFSTRIFITPLQNDGINLTGTPFLSPTELNRYKITRRTDADPE